MDIACTLHGHYMDTIWIVVSVTDSKLFLFVTTYSHVTSCVLVNTGVVLRIEPCDRIIFWVCSDCHGLMAVTQYAKCKWRY